MISAPRPIGPGGKLLPPIEPPSERGLPQGHTFLNAYQKEHYREVMEERSKQPPMSRAESTKQYHAIKASRAANEARARETP